MDFGLALFLAVGALALFTFLSITTFSEHRAKERSEFHRNETLRKVAERTGEGADKVLEVIREEHRIAQRKRLEGIKLGGLVTTMVGVGMAIFFWGLEPEIMGMAAIPLLIGLSLLFYAVFMAPRPGSD